MAENLRLAIVGVGRMGAVHARTLARVPAIDVRVVVDSRPEVVVPLADEIAAVGLTSIDDLRERSDVEAWLIATPTPTHSEIADMALEAGLHVLCEKPISLESGSASTLAAKAVELGRVLQVGFWRRFSPPWIKAKELLDIGAIGRPVLMRFTQWDANPPPPAFCDPAVSGGLAIDCGVHEYDLAEWLTGRSVRNIVALNLPVVDEGVAAAGDFDNLVALIELTDGSSAIVDLSRNARYGDDVRTEILGSDGALFVEVLPVGRTRLANGKGIAIVPGSEVKDAVSAGIAAQALAFAAAIRGVPLGGRLPGGEASERALSVGRAVQEAASTHQRVSMLAHASQSEGLAPEPDEESGI